VSSWAHLMKEPEAQERPCAACHGIPALGAPPVAQKDAGVAAPLAGANVDANLTTGASRATGTESQAGIRPSQNGCTFLPARFLQMARWLAERQCAGQAEQLAAAELRQHMEHRGVQVLMQHPAAQAVPERCSTWDAITKLADV
jgi:hypothetical protein